MIDSITYEASFSHEIVSINAVSCENDRNDTIVGIEE